MAVINPSAADVSRSIVQALEKEGEAVLRGGIYHSSPFSVPSHSRLVIEKDAELVFIPDFTLYPPVFTRWEGVQCWCMHPCIFINESVDVKIVGEGIIDGSGEKWWKTCLEKKKKNRTPETELELQFAALNPDYRNQPGGGGGREFQFLRPPLLQIRKSHDVLIEGVTFRKSPFWTVHPLFSEDITIKDVSIINPYDAPNTDGIDIESSSNVSVLSSSVDVGDDGIAIKSGSGLEGRRDNVPSRNILIKDCIVKAAHGGAVIGSETAAEISDVTVESCLFDGTDRGIRIKTRRGRGGNIHDLAFRNIRMKDNLCPFVINTYYKCGTDDDSLFSLDEKPVDDSTPVIHSITIENCHAEGSRASCGMAVGLPESPLGNVVIKDSSFSMASDNLVPVSQSDMYRGLPDPVSRGFRLRNIEVHIENTDIGCEGVKIIKEENAEIL